MPGDRAFSPTCRGRSTLPATSTGPTTASSMSRVTPPGRRMQGLPWHTSTTVDSRPTSQLPPSMISGMRPSMSSSTCRAVVGLGLPERLALGAAMGRLQVLSSAAATGWEGMRTATVSSPAVTASGTAGLRGMISVSGPGQKASISGRAASGTWHRPLSWLLSQMCTISGLSAGRPLAAKMPGTAWALRALAPRP